MNDIERAEKTSELFLEQSIARREAAITAPPPPPSYRYPLFHHLGERYGLYLVDLELDEVIAVVKSLKESSPIPPVGPPPRTCGNPPL